MPLSTAGEDPVQQRYRQPRDQPDGNNACRRGAKTRLVLFRCHQHCMLCRRRRSEYRDILIVIDVMIGKAASQQVPPLLPEHIEETLIITDTGEGQHRFACKALTSSGLSIRSISATCIAVSMRLILRLSPVSSAPVIATASARSRPARSGSRRACGDDQSIGKTTAAIENHHQPILDQAGVLHAVIHDDQIAEAFGRDKFCSGGAVMADNHRADAASMTASSPAMAAAVSGQHERACR